MPSHPILPDARRAAIEAAFDEALAEVRAAGDIALLQECRAIFRQRVPLHLRAYVAAALALKGAGASKPADRHGRNDMPARDNRETREPRGNGDNRKEGRPQKEPLPQPAQKKAEKQKPAQAVREPRAAVEPGEIREPREPREVRENRYRGEGVTLFVSAGRRQRFYARIAIKLLLDIPGVADESVGDIRTMDNYSFIVVDPAVEEAVIAGLSGYDFKGRTLAANRARKRGESAPAQESVDDVTPDTEETNDDSGSEGLEAFGSGSDADYDPRPEDASDDLEDDSGNAHDTDAEPENDGDTTENA